jgi:DNA topoisomerase-1
VEVLQQFYTPFKAALAEAQRTAQEETIAVPRGTASKAKRTGESCPQCGGDVVVRSGKYGEFLGCTDFPRCRWTSPLKRKGEKQRKEKTDERCPECGGVVAIRNGKYGQFRSCSNYPDCEWSAPLVVGTCPQCGGDLVERRAKSGIFWGCSNYPDCRHRQSPDDPKRSEERPER